MQLFDKYSPIGVFDSGIGGLTVVKQMLSRLPNENIIYFGDTARVPYGSKSNDTVIEYSNQDARFLYNKNVKLIITACNTASSVALDSLRENFDIPIIGMIEPGAKYAIKKTENGKIGVIGTYATINNGAYSKELNNIDGRLDIFEKACPLFVPLAEEGWIDHKATKLIAEEYLEEFIKNSVDTLILGCTHYPILSKLIQEVMGEDVTLVDSGTAAYFEVENYLNGRGLRNDSSESGEHQYYVSDLPEKFKTIAERFLGTEIENLEKVELDQIINS